MFKVTYLLIDMIFSNLKFIAFYISIYNVIIFFNINKIFLLKKEIL